jgi:hypothetical protein
MKQSSALSNLYSYLFTFVDLSSTEIYISGQRMISFVTNSKILIETLVSFLWPENEKCILVSCDYDLRSKL